MKQKKDQVLVRYIGKPERVADLVNVNCFRGEQIIRAEDLVDTFSELLGERKRLRIVKNKQETEGEKIDMCKAFDELEERGIKKGIEKGIAKGIAEGKASLIAVVRAKVNKGMKAQEIAELLEMDGKETEHICDLIVKYPQKDDVEIAAEM